MSFYQIWVYTDYRLIIICANLNRRANSNQFIYQYIKSNKANSAFIINTVKLCKRMLIKQSNWMQVPVYDSKINFILAHQNK